MAPPSRWTGCRSEAKSFHPGRKARHHLRWVAASNGVPARRVNEVLETVGLSAVANKRAGSFSLGMAQRLGLATALLGDPPILLLDEPVNGLDPEGILWIRQFMKNYAAQGRTVFVSSQARVRSPTNAARLRQDPDVRAVPAVQRRRPDHPTRGQRPRALPVGRLRPVLRVRAGAVRARGDRGGEPGRLAARAGGHPDPPGGDAEQHHDGQGEPAGGDAEDGAYGAGLVRAERSGRP